MMVRSTEVVHSYKTLGSPKPIEVKDTFPQSDFSDWIGKKILAFGISCDSPVDTYVQLSGEETNQVLDMIAEDVAKIPEDFLKSGQYVPEPGSPCLALYHEDNTWYRGRVVGYKDDMVQVFFVDYGNTEEMPKTNITICPKHLVQFVEGISLCALYGFTGDESKEEVDIVKETIENKDFIARIESVDHDINGKQRILLTAYRDHVDLKVFVQNRLAKRHKVIQGRQASEVSKEPIPAVQPDAKIQNDVVAESNVAVQPNKVDDTIILTVDTTVDSMVKKTESTDDLSIVNKQVKLTSAAPPVLMSPSSPKSQQILTTKGEDEFDGLLTAPRSPVVYASLSTVEVVSVDSKASPVEDLVEVLSENLKKEEDVRAAFEQMEKELRQKIVEQEEEIVHLRQINNATSNELDIAKQQIEKLKTENMQKDRDVAQIKMIQIQKDEEEFVRKEDMSRNFDEHLKMNDERWRIKFENSQKIYDKSKDENRKELQKLKENLFAETELRKEAEQKCKTYVLEQDELKKLLHEQQQSESSVSVSDNSTSTDVPTPSSVPIMIEPFGNSLEIQQPSSYEDLLKERNGLISQLTKSIDAITSSFQHENESLRLIIRKKNEEIVRLRDD